MTSITRVGGVVVVTQVIPQDGNAIPLHAAPQAPPPAARAPPTKTDDEGLLPARETRGLGVVQIFIGLLCILVSATAALSPVLMGHAPLCLAVSFVVSGSVALAAARRTSVRRVWASLVWNLLSVLLGLVGVAYLCWLLAGRAPSERLCGSSVRGKCSSRMWRLDVCVNGLLGLVLVLLVLQVCVAATVCVFSAKAIRRHDHKTPVMVEVHDGGALLSGVASECGSDVGLLDSENMQ